MFSPKLFAVGAGRQQWARLEGGARAHARDAWGAGKPCTSNSVALLFALHNPVRCRLSGPDALPAGPGPGHGATQRTLLDHPPPRRRPWLGIVTSGFTAVVERTWGGRDAVVGSSRVESSSGRYSIISYSVDYLGLAIAVEPMSSCFPHHIPLLQGTQSQAGFVCAV